MQCSVPLTGRVSQKNFPRILKVSVQRRNRKIYKCQSGLFDIFGGQGKSSAAVEEIVDEILELSRPTYAGVFAGKKRKQQIAELVDQLREYRGRAPTRSPKFWGLYEIIYTETPFDISGPFRKPPALLVLQGQKLYQNVEKAKATVTNLSSFKTLGLFKGYTRLYGKVEILSGDQFRYDFSHVNYNLGIGGVSTRRSEFDLTFNLIYLDARLRIVTATDKDVIAIFEKVNIEDTSLSPDDIAYNEFIPSGGEQEYYEEQAVYQVEEEDEEQSKKPSFFNFSLNGRKAQVGGGTVAIQNSKQPGSGTVRLTQSTSMDDVRSIVKMYQQQVKDAKQAKKQLSTSLREQQQQQDELAKQSEKIQQQVNRTEVEVENVRQMLVQINDEEKQSYKQLELLQNKLQELETSAKA